MIKAVIFDWGRTLYDSENDALFPDTVNTLQYLATTYILAIVSLATDGNFGKRLAVLRDEDIETLFNTVLFAKNDKDELYRQTLVHLNLDTHEVAIVDDRVVRGIQWGNKHTSVTIWLCRGKFMGELPNHETGSPTYTISCLGDLRNIL